MSSGATVPVDEPTRLDVHWGCPDCGGAVQETAAVERVAPVADPLAPAAADAGGAGGASVPTHCTVECWRCGCRRTFALSDHALDQWAARVGPPRRALVALVEGLAVDRVGVDEPTRYYPPLRAVLPVGVTHEGARGVRVVATTAVAPTGRHRLDLDGDGDGPGTGTGTAPGLGSDGRNGGGRAAPSGGPPDRCPDCAMLFNPLRTPLCPWCARGIECNPTSLFCQEAP